MVTEKQILCRKRNWLVFRLRGVLPLMKVLQQFFYDRDDRIAYDECEKCFASVIEILRKLEGYKA